MCAEDSADTARPTWTRLLTGIANPKCVQSSAGIGEARQLMLLMKIDSSDLAQSVGGSKDTGPRCAMPVAGAVEPRRARLCIEVGGPIFRKSVAERLGPRQARLRTNTGDPAWQPSRIDRMSPVLTTPNAKKAKPSCAEDFGGRSGSIPARSNAKTGKSSLADERKDRTKSRCKGSSTGGLNSIQEMPQASIGNSSLPELWASSSKST